MFIMNILGILISLFSSIDKLSIDIVSENFYFAHPSQLYEFWVFKTNKVMMRAMEIL